MVLERQLSTKSSTYCLLLLIKIMSWQFCGGVDFLNAGRELRRGSPPRANRFRIPYLSGRQGMLPHIVYQSNGFRKSTTPPNRQLIVRYYKLNRRELCRRPPPRENRFRITYLSGPQGPALPQSSWLIDFTPKVDEFAWNPMGTDFQSAQKEETEPNV